MLRPHLRAKQGISGTKKESRDLKIGDLKYFVVILWSFSLLRLERRYKTFDVKSFY